MSNSAPIIHTRFIGDMIPHVLCMSGVIDLQGRGGGLCPPDNILLYLLYAADTQYIVVGHFPVLFSHLDGTRCSKLLICYHHFPVLARHTYLLLKNLIRIFLNGDNLRWTLTEFLDELSYPNKSCSECKQDVRKIHRQTDRKTFQLSCQNKSFSECQH